MIIHGSNKIAFINCYIGLDNIPFETRKNTKHKHHNCTICTTINPTIQQ